MKYIFSLYLGLLCSVSVFAQQKLIPVNAESNVHFEIHNFGLNTRGKLEGLKGQIIFDMKNLSNSLFDVTVDVTSIDTDNGTRDKHLFKEEYFNVSRYPTIHIIGKPILLNKDRYVLKANLTIKDVTKLVDIPFTIKPQLNGYLFEGNFQINRMIFHVGDNSAVLGDDVKINLKVLAR
jgi:polyisoprenoid-binding protein YceI